MFKRSVHASVLLSVLFAASLLLAGCSQEKEENRGRSEVSAEQQEKQEKQVSAEKQEKQNSSSRLAVFEWAGYELPEFHTKFTEKYPDAPPQFSFFATDEEGYSKAKNGFPFDIVHPCTQYFHFYAKSGILKPLDTSRIEHWNDLSPALVEAGKVDGVTSRLHD